MRFVVVAIYEGDCQPLLSGGILAVRETADEAIKAAHAWLTEINDGTDRDGIVSVVDLACVNAPYVLKNTHPDTASLGVDRRPPTAFNKPLAGAQSRSAAMRERDWSK